MDKDLARALDNYLTTDPRDIEREEFRAELFELYPVFKEQIYTIGSTQYKREDCSPMLTQVYIKTHLDNDFRAVKDYFGEEAWLDAHNWIMEQMNN